MLNSILSMAKKSCKYLNNKVLIFFINNDKTQQGQSNIKEIYSLLEPLKINFRYIKKH